MGRKSRCPDVAGKIIQYLRDQNAVSTTAGIEVTTQTIANNIGATQNSVCVNMRRLIGHKIVFLPKGTFDQGYAGPRSFALREGHEDGDEWRKTYYTENGSAPCKTTKPAPVLASEVVRQKVESDRHTELLQEYLQLSTRFTELQQKYIEVQCERNDALETVRKQAATIEEMRNDLSLETQAAHKSQEVVTQLELQLRQARSQIAKNDERRQVAFAHR